MSTAAMISPAFDPFLAGSGANDKREAIVLYRTPTPKTPPVRGRMRELKKRLDYVKRRAALQRPVEAKLYEGYRKVGSKMLKSSAGLAYTAIGNSTLPVATMEVTRTTLPELASQANVLAVMPNQRIHRIQPKQIDYTKLATRERNSRMTWGLKQLQISKVWETSQGENINVAVLDTGVYGAHPALAGRVKDFVVVDPLGNRITAKPTFDGGQHGTHVCDTIAGGKTDDGVAIGVAPGANLLVAGVLVGSATLQTLLEGMSWAIQKGADIISMSLGFTYYEPLFALVLREVLDYGVLPVVAIGNENRGNTSCPGNVEPAFSVGAVEKVKGGKTEVAFFSSGASLVFPGEEPGLVIKPDVVAPGAQVYSCIPPEKAPDGIYQYTYMDGTSMATPHVAGVAALLMKAKPTAPITDMIEVLKQTAKHPDGDAQRPDNRWGHGLIQPVEALEAL